MGKKYRDLTPEEDAAIQAYAECHGRYWKSKLHSDWLSGLDTNFKNGATLRRIRNELGPLWLKRYGRTK